MANQRTRRIAHAYKSIPTLEGAGVHLKRAFGNNHVPLFDPFLLLDDFHSSNPDDYVRGFPWHPHRGIETVTYILQGSVEHGDSMGNAGTIRDGEVQWMTAGGGIIHQEMPKEVGDGMLWGTQLWVNLPAASKMMPPRYRDVKVNDIPTVLLDSGASVKIVAGKLNGTQGPVQDIVTAPEYLDVSLPPGGSFTRHYPPGHTVFAYVLEGGAFFDEQRDAFAHDMTGPSWWQTDGKCICDAESLVLYEREGDQIVVTAGDKATRFLLISGKPIGEPVAWCGPVVMNTQDELRTAFEQYRDGTFIKEG